MQVGHQVGLEETAPNEKTREVRLGLVMYGGVSLAIYINGVVQEFFNAVRGRGVYRLIKALTDSDVVVDIISGTSAGGINGILLANALCARKELAPTAMLWREHGGIQKMLRAAYGDAAMATSLLDGEGFYQPKLEDAFRALNEGPTLATPRSDEDPSAISELDLFVTGTDVDGLRYTDFDDQGHPLEVRDHRAVFQLKQRAGRKNAFALDAPLADRTATYVALAKLAQITSCFPGAFTPVQVGKPAVDAPSRDALLQEWGQLGREAVLMDGGVLDNKPFSHTLRAVFSRTALREVDRKIFFVEPDPEKLTKLDGPSRPNIVQTVLASLITIPRYESIADDLRSLSERNRRLRRYQRVVDQLQPHVAASTTTHAASATTDAVSADTSQPDSATRHLYVRSRMVSLTDRVVDGLFKADGRRELLKPTERDRAAQLIKHFDELAIDEQQILDDFDVEFRLRRLYRIVYAIYELLFNAVTPVSIAEGRVYRDVLVAFNRQIELYEILVAAVERMLDGAPIQWRRLEDRVIWAIVQRALQKLLDVRSGPVAGLPLTFTAADAWLPQQALEDLNHRLRDEITEICAAIQDGATSFRTPDPNGFCSVLRSLDESEEAILQALLPEASDRLRRAYTEFEALDARVFPLEVIGDLREKDLIETVRISPRDAQKGFSEQDLPNKVSGDTLYHFGAFFKRSWRSNDILWGRLDGLCELTEALVPQARVATIVGSEEWRARVRDRFFERATNATDGREEFEFRSTLDPEALFSNAGAPTQRRLGDWLRALLVGDETARKNALQPDVFSGNVDLLIEAAQLEVLLVEVPNVIMDAISEQDEWNQFQVAVPAPLVAGVSEAEDTPSTKFALPPWVFRGPSHRLDPFVAIAGAAQIMQTAILDFAKVVGKPERPRDTPLGTFFRSAYKVGSESLTRDIPTQVLLEILATALLVTRACVLVVFGDRAATIRGNAMYRLAVDLPLRAFYAFAVGLRSPGWFLAALAALLLVAATILAIGVFFGGVLVMTAGGISWHGALIFVVLPVLTMLIALALAAWQGRRLATRRAGYRRGPVK